MLKKYSFAFLIATLFTTNITTAQTTITVGNTTLTEREVAIGVQVPWEILWGPDDHIWATERRGQVLRIDPENGNTETVLNIQSQVDSGGEPGLLGMALHPDFENTPKVYLAYNYSQGFSTKERLVSFDWDGTELSNELILLDNINGGGIHNGSRLLISTDEKILMTTGDRGNSDLSQNLEELNGKLLRINLDGSIPADNPIADSYIYSYGHRNAQGLAYGPNGQLYSSEHGAQQSDEFNLIEENRNYGWPNVQGECNTSSEINFCNTFNVREPLAEWSPCIAVNGIEYYNHPAIPEWEGKMMMAVLGGLGGQYNRLTVMEFNADGTEIIGQEDYFDDYGRIRDVCINPDNGALFFATNGGSYPGSGPNRIIEYRNLDFIIDNVNEENATQFINVFPNPASQTVGCFARFSDNFIGQKMELIAYNGQSVETFEITNNQMELPIQKLAKGNYYVKATNAKGTITKKVVIQ